jgi:hypothetical protein
MSVIQRDKIDAIGISKDQKGLILMLADHLDWGNEIQHLTLLQDKVNAYVNFIETKQYLEIYPNSLFEYYIIDLKFKYEVVDNCMKFIKVVNEQLKEYNVQIRTNF